MASQSRVVPCCELDIVGGDGTAIGIPISNLKGMTPVWQPAECVGLQVPDDQEFENGRMAAFQSVSIALTRQKLRLPGANSEISSRRAFLKSCPTSIGTIITSEFAIGYQPSSMKR